MFCERFISWKLQKCFDKIRKLFWKKNVYSPVSTNLRTVFKTFQKTDLLPKRLQTAIDANTGRNDDRKRNKKRKKTTENEKTLIQNVSKKQKNKDSKTFQIKHQKWHEFSSKKWYVSSEFLKKKLFQRHYNDLYADHFDQIKILIFLKKTIFMTRNFSKN